MFSIKALSSKPLTFEVLGESTVYSKHIEHVLVLLGFQGE